MLPFKIFLKPSNESSFFILITSFVNHPRVNFYHFRTSQGKEVDFVIEKNNGDILAIEVKPSTTMKSNDKKGLFELQSITKNKFKKGIILYNGDEIIPFGDNIWAIPVEKLWK